MIDTAGAKRRQPKATMYRGRENTVVRRLLGVFLGVHIMDIKITMMLSLTTFKRMMAFAPVMMLLLLLPERGNAIPVINEFMASNGATIADPQGEYDDWIEIYNPGPGTVDLGGMYLTDNPLNPTQWQFPSGTFLGQGSFLLVWADKDVLDNTNGFHANFKLGAGGEQIGLYESNGVTLVDSISFGNQSEDVSYGRFPNGASTWYFMDQPSPNATNTSAQSEDVYFSRLGGIMTNSFTLKLSTKSDIGSIRYTTDGAEPSSGSTLYNDGSGILIDNTHSRRIRARAFQSGLVPGPVRTEAYLAVSPALAAFDSNVPILVIDTFGDSIPGTTETWLQDVYATAIDTNSVTGRAALSDQPDFAGRAGMRVRGTSAAELDKKPYKLETWDENDGDKKISLLGFPSESDWVLHNPHMDKTFLRNVLVYQWSNDMGHYSSRTKFIEVFKNENGGQIGGPTSGDYVGVYVLAESIKRGKGRVDVEALRLTDTTEPEVTGGYIIKHDRRESETPHFNTWAGDFLYVEPSETEITTAQTNYIKSYIEEFEGVLQGAEFADPVNGYANYIDVESFIDHDFCSEIAKDVDAYRLSTYMSKARDGKLAMSAEWDYNLSMGNNDYTSLGTTNAHHTTGWNLEGDLTEYNWHARLLNDPEYRLKYADRWFHLRETVLSDATVAQTIDTHVALLNVGAAGRNFSRWDILNSKVSFDWSGDGPTFYYGGNPHIPCETNDHTYWMQAEWLKNWLTGTGTPTGSCAAEAYAPQYSDRLGWIDDNMEDRTGAGAPPSLFINGSPADTGGAISGSNTLTMSGGPGTIYYTLDGTDPREAFTSNAVGTAYSVEGITLNKTVDVRARIKNGSSWSAVNQAVFADNRPLNDLRITEIMYHPETLGEEYIELKNIGASAINLNLCEFTDGIRFTFPDMMLAAGQHVLVVQNQSTFETRYGTGLNIAGEFNIGSSLGNGGEEIVLKDAAGREILDFDYGDWYPVTDGHGASLGIVDSAHADLTLWDRKEGWQASSTNGGSPGADHSVNGVANNAIVINEALTHTDETGGDWIELYNTTGAPIDIGGWFLSDSLDDLKKYQIASGTSITGGAYVVFTEEDHFGLLSSDPGKRIGFGLSELGESVFLSSGSGGNLSGGFSISEDFGAAVNGVTFGRHTKSAASGYGVDFVAMKNPTMGAANSGPLIPDVVINQIMYNPSTDHDEVAEYIGLFNHTKSSVNLYDPANPSNTWKFSKGIEYTFPPGVSIPAGSHVLVVRTDPDIFRHLHGIPLIREIYGPYSDVLSNDGEKIELSMPGAPEPGFVPYIRTEKVNFSDGSHSVGSDPWPTEADGTLGYSLHRSFAENYGNDVANWQAAAPNMIYYYTFPYGWGYKIPITISSNHIDSALTDWTLVFDHSFDVLLTSENGPLDADGTQASLNGGGDVRFSADAAGTIQLACDIRAWVTDNNPANATCEVAVKVPTVSSSADTTIYMWWGQAGAIQPGLSDTYGQYNTYDSSYSFVMPLDEDPSGGSGAMKDRTRNQNHGTRSGGSISSVTGKIGNALTNDGSSDYIEMSSHSAFDLSDKTGCIEFLTDASSTQPAWSGFISKGDDVNDWVIQRNNATTDLSMSFPGSPLVWDNWFDSYVYGQGWVHFALRMDGSNAYLYENAALAGGAKALPATVGHTSDHPVRIMAERAGIAVDATMDEVRISTSDRSVAWIKANYHNQLNTSGFLTWGSITPASDSDSGGTLLLLR